MALRTFNSIPIGEKGDLGSYHLSLQEIVDFASRYDPQPFHVDPEQASQSIYGGLIASGFHTGSIFMRLVALGFLNQVASQGSPGISDLSWLSPVRPGDTLYASYEITKTERSLKKPDLGKVFISGSLTNQNGNEVLHVEFMIFAKVE